MVAQYTIMADAVASTRVPVANSKGQARTGSSGTSFDQHLKEQTKAAPSRDNRDETQNGLRDASRTNKSADANTKSEPSANQTTAPNAQKNAKGPSDNKDEATQTVSTHSEIEVQIDQGATKAAEASSALKTPEGIPFNLPETQSSEDGTGEVAPTEEVADLPDMPTANPELPLDAELPAQPDADVAANQNSADAGKTTVGPVTPSAPSATDLPTADANAAAGDAVIEAVSAQNATSQTDTKANEETQVKPAPTPQIPVQEANGQATDIKSAADPNAARPAPELSQQQVQTDATTDAVALDAAKTADPATPSVTEVPAADTAASDTDVSIDKDAVIVAAVASDDGADDAGNIVEAKPAEPKTHDVNELDAAKKPTPAALTLPEQQPQTNTTEAVETASVETAAPDETSVVSDEDAATARPEQVVTKDKMLQPASNSTDVAANAVSTDTGATDADASSQSQSKEEAKAARPEQLANKMPAKSAGATDATPQQSQAANNQADARATNRPSDNQSQSDDVMVEADKSRSTKSETAARDEPKQAGRQAPKGEAFSQLMAKINTLSGLKDTAMQTDPTLRVDTATAMQGDATTVRLTGMEHLGRTGQMPQQAALANAQAIAAQISKFANKGETRFEIRLDPADLGKVDVRLTIGSDGQTRAHLFVEKSETMDFLMRDQRFLERSLQQSGLNLDKQGVEYSLMDQQGQQQQHMTGEQGQQDFDQDGIANNRQTEEEQLPTPSVLETNQSGTYMASNGVNLVI